MAIFDKPDFEKMLQNEDWPMLVHYANYTKDQELRREATKVAGRDPYLLVQYLYETAQWTRQNTSMHGKRLPRRGIRQIDDAVALLHRLGSRAATPLASSVHLYGQYGDPDEEVRTLYFTIVFSILEKMGAKAADELRDLARADDEAIRAPARETLQRLLERGVIEADMPDRRSPGA